MNYLNMNILKNSYLHYHIVLNMFRCFGITQYKICKSYLCLVSKEEIFIFSVFFASPGSLYWTARIKTVKTWKNRRG